MYNLQNIHIFCLLLCIPQIEMRNPDYGVTYKYNLQIYCYVYAMVLMRSFLKEIKYATKNNL